MRKPTPRALAQAFVLTATMVMMVAGFIVLGGFNSQDDAEAFPCVLVCRPNATSTTSSPPTSGTTTTTNTYSTEDETSTQITTTQTEDGSTTIGTTTTHDFDTTITDSPQCRRWFCRNNWF